MQILIKKIDEAEPTTVLNDVFMILEDKIDYEEETIIFYTMDNNSCEQTIIAIKKKDLEYFRKVGD